MAPTYDRRIQANTKVQDIKLLLEDVSALKLTLRKAAAQARSIQYSLGRLEGTSLDVENIRRSLSDPEALEDIEGSLRQALNEATYVGGKLKLYHGTTETFQVLKPGQYLTDDFGIAKSYAEERARERGRATIHVYEFHVQPDEIGGRKHNVDQGHDQWLSEVPLTPVKATTINLR